MKCCFTGLPVSQESLNEAAELSEVLIDEDYLNDVREKCENIIPEISEVQSKDAAET